MYDEPTERIGLPIVMRPLASVIKSGDILVNLE